MSDVPLRCRPLGIAGRQAAGPGALPLAGGPLAFAACEAIRRPAPGRIERETLGASEFAERAITEGWLSASDAWATGSQ